MWKKHDIVFSMVYEFSKASFHPRVGDAYDGAHFGLKLLIMGESHYRWTERPGDETKTTRVALENGRGRHQFWRRLEGLIPTPENETDPRGWDSVAFYNYVQEFVGDKPRDRPTDEMWTSKPTLDGFREVLEVCRPNRILVVGKTSWRQMAGKDHFPLNPPIIEPQFKLPYSFCAGLDPGSEQNAYWYPTSQGSYALCAPIFHTAYPKGFHGEGTKDVMKKLLSREWNGLTLAGTLAAE